MEDWGGQVEVHSMEERYLHIARRHRSTLRPSVSNLQTRREQTSRYDSQQSDSYWSRSYSLFLFSCFVFGQISKGSNQSCEGTRFVVLDFGVQVFLPWTGAGTLLLELAQEWDQGTNLFTRSGTENETTVEYMFRLFKWAS